MKYDPFWLFGRPYPSEPIMDSIPVEALTADRTNSLKGLDIPCPAVFD